MYRVTGVTLLVLSLGLAVPLRAQTGALGNLPRFAQRPPNLPLAHAPALRMAPSQAQMPKLVRPQDPGLSVSRRLPKLTFGSWPPKPGPATVLQGKNPYQPNPLFGRNPFDPPKQTKKK